MERRAGPPARTTALALLALAASASGDDAIEFNRDIRPILSEKCFHCHGPDEKTREAKLRLDERDNAYKNAIVPGSLKKSEFWYRVTTDDEEEIMPPPETGKDLTKEEIDLLSRWIEGGAEYQDHWAFIPPVRPQAAAGSAGIDELVGKQLDANALSRSKPAEKHILLRRLSLDLTGLPPTPEELEAFVADESPDAVERVVDRLLASPHYGEHMGRYWLDAVRYGDTHGLHLDNYREFWPYRDWIVRAFNENKPWDDFLTEQLAGDLLENPTVSQLVATGYNRAHVTTAEGGSIKEEVLVRNVADRVSTFGTVMLGLTTGCAACHDHKFDPLTQREYYQLFAYFNSLDADPMDGNKKDHAPVIRVPGPDDEAKLTASKHALEQARKALDDSIASYDYQEPKTPDHAGPVEVTWIDDALPKDANKQGGWNWVTSVEGQAVLSGGKARSQSGEGTVQHYFEGKKEPYMVGEDATFFAHVFIGKNAPEQIMLQFNSGKWEHRAYWGADKIDWGKNGTPSRLKKGDLPKSGEWVRLEVDASEVGLKPGDKINGVAFTQFGGTAYWDAAGMRSIGSGYTSFNKWVHDERAKKKSGLPADLEKILRKDGPKVTSDEKDRLLRHYIADVDLKAREALAPLRAAVSGHEQEITNIEKNFPSTLIWKEKAQPRPSRVLDRGEYDRPTGDPVPRALPSFLPPLPETAPNDRLGIARWLTSKDHPLAARVAVNRLWQQLFGIGLVKTAGDFGSQGEWPSHPELLDWLAVEFRESGWDVKRLMKLIVLSKTYQQTSVASPEDYKRDPDNRLLSRGPRFRLDGEVLRDQALAVSGLLVPKVGGPGVKPPQPDGLWKAVGYQSSNTVKFVADKGPDKVHRRSLYTFWKRTSPPPQMIDAPSREACVVRRERTNTPLHALMFMNDPQFVEAARYFAERFIDLSDDEIVGALFEHALSRSPSADEASLTVDSFKEHLAHYRTKPDEAKKLISIGDSPSASDQPERLAAWTMVASMVLNLDEFVTKN
ncbi:DUF1553 domain-containing protein [Haloferula helveola]|uniref:DUF1553 domain-containing protein n=1 Tax=Haloferula helveola TaxID=490095 RepID=A0ABN6GY40_9BACT|nr:DUF1553 domain-containing protein [Haloferula helveola]